MSCVCHAFVSVHFCLVDTCLERQTSWLLFVMFNCVLSLFHVVPWVRCDTRLYPFMIFVAFLTLNRIGESVMTLTSLAPA